MPDQSPYLWHADACYLPPCLEATIRRTSPWNDTEACAKAIVLWYKSQGAGQDYEYDHPILCKVIQGLSDRSKEKLSEDRIRQIVSDGLSSWRTFITCEEMRKSLCLKSCCVPADCKVEKERLAAATGAEGYAPLIELGEKITLKSLALWIIERWLLELPDNRMVFDARDGNNPYFWVQCGSHKRLMGLLSSDLVDELARRILEDERNHGGLALSSTTLRELIPSIRALGRRIAQARGQEASIQMATRIREIDGAIWYDLGWNDWMGLKIEPGKISMEPLPVGFLRRGSMLAQVEPDYSAKPDDIFLLGLVANVPPEGLLFCLVWLVASFISTIRDIPIPKTILWLSGPHGSAKTSLAEFLTCLIDPDRDAMKSPPEDIKDLASILQSYHVAVLDNVTKIDKWLSDALCQVSTGGALTKRALYTDFDLITARYNSQIILTSMGTPRIESDLNERVLFVYPDPIEDAGRKSKVEVAMLFDELKPLIFGGLLRTVATVLEMLPDVYEESNSWSKKPRMLDFAIIGEACCRAWSLPAGAFVETYNLSLNSESADLISNIEIITALKMFMVNQAPKKEWTGLVSQLLADLSYQEKGFKDYGDLPEWWPKTSSSLGRMLSKYSADLAREGYHIKGHRHTMHGEQITIIKSDSADALSSSHIPLMEKTDIYNLIDERMRDMRERVNQSQGYNIDSKDGVSPKSPKGKSRFFSHFSRMGQKSEVGGHESSMRGTPGSDNEDKPEAEGCADGMRKDERKLMRCEECHEETEDIYEIGEGDFIMRFCKKCYEAYLDDISGI